MTPQDRLDYLLADVWVPTNATITVAEIVSAVGMDPARLVVGTLQDGAAQDPILAASYQAITTVGMNLSTAERQGLVDQLAVAGTWPDAVRDAVKSLGGIYRKQWEVELREAEPTLDELTKQSIIAATRTAITSKATAINAWLDAVDTATMTAEELQTYCDGLLASADGNGE